MTIPARAAAARKRLAAIIRGEGDDPWTDADVVRLDALVALGRPAEVLAPGSAKVEPDPAEERWGTVGTRSEGGREAEVRASALHTWRGVGGLAGLPLPSPHEFKSTATG